MSIIEVPIPEHIQGQLASNGPFVLRALDSWREAASAAAELVKDNFSRVQESEGEEKEFYAWEIVCAAVEIVELVASLVAHVRSPDASRFHAVDNPTLKRIFESLKKDGISRSEANSLLRLLIPKGFSRASARLAWVHGRVVERTQATISRLARFWLDNADDARWWRHLPMSLTFDESLAVSSTSAGGGNDVMQEIGRTPERISAMCRLDEQQKAFECTVLKMADVRNAVDSSNLASQLIINIASNQIALLLRAERPVRHLFPLFTNELAPVERDVLLNAGYTLV